MTAPEATDPTPGEVRPGMCPSCGPGYRYGDEGCRHTPPGGVRLSEAEREALDVMGMFPTAQGFAQPAEWERETGARLFARVEGILAARDAEAEGPVIPNAGPWEHMDGTPCPYYVASRPRPDDENYWWCTEHQQHVRTSGAPESIRDRDALISYLEVRLARAEAAEAEVAELRKRAVSALIATGRHTVDTARAALGGEHA